MKKQFLFGMAAVAALCSCSNNEVLEAPESLKTPIAFGTYVGSNVNGRAAETKIENMKGTIPDELTTANKKGFGVFAYYTPQQSDNLDWSSNDATVTKIPNYMFNQKVEMKNETSVWTYSPLKYWPNNSGDKVHFFAYSPYSSSKSGEVSNSSDANDIDNITAFCSNSEAGRPTVTFTVNKTVKEQQDLLYASVTNCEKPSIETPTATGKSVFFDFKHALALVQFTVQAMVDKVNTAEGTESSNVLPTETTIKVRQVELLGKFYKSGTLDLGTGTFTSQQTIAEEGSETYKTTAPTVASGITQGLPASATEQGYGFELKRGATNDASNFIVANADNVSITEQPLNNNESNIMLIPQEFTGENKVKIRVTYDVITSDSQLNGGNSTITNVITSDGFTFSFVKGKRHTFKLYLGMTSVKFAASISDWTDGTDKVIDVPINTTGGN